MGIIHEYIYVKLTGVLDMKVPNRLVVGDSQYRCRILWPINHQGMYQNPPYVVSQCEWLGPKVHMRGTAAPTGTYEQH